MHTVPPSPTRGRCPRSHSHTVRPIDQTQRCTPPFAEPSSSLISNAPAPTGARREGADGVPHAALVGGHRKLKADRLARPAVREEPLRTAGSFSGETYLALSAWRGRSGRRYVVVTQALDAPDLVAEYAAVVLAVARDAQGRASVVAVRACERGDSGLLGWLAACARLGARELHIHRLAEGRTERAAIAADLIDPVTPTSLAPGAP